MTTGPENDPPFQAFLRRAVAQMKEKGGITPNGIAYGSLPLEPQGAGSVFLLLTEPHHSWWGILKAKWHLRRNHDVAFIMVIPKSRAFGTERRTMMKQ